MPWCGSFSGRQVSLLCGEAGSLYYNQQLPTWHIARRGPQDGDEDDLIHQLKRLSPIAVTDVSSPLRHALRDESGLRLRNLESGEDHWLKYPSRDDQESPSP